MDTITRIVTTLTTAAVLAFAPALSHAERVAKVVADYTVFVDLPTGFVFVKLPSGWKFVGQVDNTNASALPAGVVTALLTGDDEVDQATHLAQAR
jgi:hypothetical protein